MEDMEAANRETLECARYGESEDLEEFLKGGADPNYADGSGNTALHKAAANGEVECLLVLLKYGSKHVQNHQGNYPIHWAAQNGKVESLRFLLTSYEVDVLSKNIYGRSTLTEAFQSKDAEAIELCLSHSSATEERLLPESPTSNPSTSQAAEKESIDNKKKVMDKQEESIDSSVTHFFRFIPGGDPTVVAATEVLKVRELPISRADNPFGSDESPESDTTGLGLWPATVLTARWALHHWSLLAGKVVLELGAGCGLPGLAVALYTRAAHVYITDIHSPTLMNAQHNVELNRAAANAITSSQEPPVAHVPVHVSAHPASAAFLERYRVSVLRVDWSDPSSYPPTTADVVLGSDLVYDGSILAVLVPALSAMIAPDGSFLYVAPTSGRAGMADFVTALDDVGIYCIESMGCPEEFYKNPLVNEETAMELAGEGEEDCESLTDKFILHFYDLSAKVPHTLYHFKRKG